MSNDDNTPGNAPASAPPPAQPPVPAATGPTHATPQPHYTNPGTLSAADGAALLAAINTLPERIVNSAREAFQPAAPPAPSSPPAAPAEPKAEPAAKVDQSPGNKDMSPRERFVKWWGA